MEPTPPHSPDPLESPPSPPPPAEPGYAGRGGNLPLGIVAGVVAGALCPLLWYGIYEALANLWIPILLTGLVIGAAVRLVGRTSDKWAGIAAAGLSVLANAGGYVVVTLALFQWVDPSYHPTVGEALSRLVNDIGLVVLLAIGGYLAFIIARARG